MTKKLITGIKDSNANFNSNDPSPDKPTDIQSASIDDQILHQECSTFPPSYHSLADLNGITAPLIDESNQVYDPLHEPFLTRDSFNALNATSQKQISTFAFNGYSNLEIGILFSLSILTNVLFILNRDFYIYQVLIRSFNYV